MNPVSIRKVSTPPPLPGNGGATQPPPVPHKVTPASQPRSVKSVWLLRSLLLLAVVASAILVYWSYTKRFQPVADEQRDKTGQMTRLADEIEQLRFKWGPQQIEQVKAQYSEAKTSLFGSQDDIDNWDKRVRAEANMRVLELEHLDGEVAPHSVLTNDVDLLPITMQVRPLPILVTTNTPYSRLVHFAEGITATTEKRFEIVSLSVEGDSNSVAQAVAVVNLFVSKTP